MIIGSGMFARHSGLNQWEGQNVILRNYYINTDLITSFIFCEGATTNRLKEQVEMVHVLNTPAGLEKIQ